NKLAIFKKQNGEQHYLLEIDTSDNRKTMSTRIMSFKAGNKAEKCIDKILRQTVKGSLRWPRTMTGFCEPLHSVHHPKESSSGANHTRVFDWKQRIRAALG
ncbi:transposase, partial [Pseudomonas aeruginosa]|nr:transposase [Pseudomonas aeruginosa]